MTDEEITAEAEKLFGVWIRCDDITSIKLLERVIKKGIEIGRKEMREELLKNKDKDNYHAIGDIDDGSRR